MRRFMLMVVCFAMVACQGGEREVQVVTGRGDVVAGATVSVLPSFGEDRTEPAEAVTDANGVARFGRGEWTRLVSIKVVHEGVTLYDAVNGSDGKRRFVVTAKRPAGP